MSEATLTVNTPRAADAKTAATRETLKQKVAKRKMQKITKK